MAYSRFVPISQAGARSITAADLDAAFDAVSNPIATNTVSQRSLGDRFAERLSVRDFGAAGDGVSNDTIAVQQAINAAAGTAPVWIPPNMICSVTGLTIGSDTHLILEGQLKLATAANTALLTVTNGALNVHISGTGTLDGNRAAQTGGVNCPGIYAVSAAHLLIENITIANCRNSPVFFWGCNDGTLRNLNLVYSGNRVQFANGCSNCVARDLFISNIDDAGFSFYSGNYSCTISGCVIQNCVGDAIDVLCDGGAKPPNHDLLITNNVALGNGGGIVSILAAFGGTGNHTGIVIAGNRGSDNRAGGGLLGSIHLSACQNITVQNNSIGPDGRAGIGATAGISVDAGTGVADIITITGNHIIDQGTGKAASGFGMTFANLPTNVVVMNNVVRDTRGASSTTQGAFLGHPGAGFVLADNHTSGMIANSVLSLNTLPDAVLRQTGIGFSFGVSGALPFFTVNAAITAQGGGTALTGNNLTLTGQASGSPVLVTANGLDTNIDIDYATKGSGKHVFTSGAVQIPRLLTDNYANDAAAAAGGVLVGQTYRNGSIVMVRVT